VWGGVNMWRGLVLPTRWASTAAPTICPEGSSYDLLA